MANGGGRQPRVRPPARSRRSAAVSRRAPRRSECAARQTASWSRLGRDAAERRSTPACSPATLTRRWRCSATPTATSARCSAPSATRPTAPCCTPTRRSCRAVAGSGRAGITSALRGDTGRELSVTYWMNALQPLATARDYFVTLNPHRPIAPGCVHRRFDYRHPAFDQAAHRCAAPTCGACRGGGAPGSAAAISATASTRTACSPVLRRPRLWAACAAPGRLRRSSAGSPRCGRERRQPADRPLERVA